MTFYSGKNIFCTLFDPPSPQLWLYKYIRNYVSTYQSCMRAVRAEYISWRLWLVQRSHQEYRIYCCCSSNRTWHILIHMNIAGRGPDYLKIAGRGYKFRPACNSATYMTRIQAFRMVQCSLMDDWIFKIWPTNLTRFIY